MKNKFLLLTTGLVIAGSTIMAQTKHYATPTMSSQDEAQINTKKPGGARFAGANPLLTVNAGDTLWYSDFSNTGDWVITNQGSLGWTITPTVSVWAFTTFSSTSGGNFAQMDNGNPQNTTTTAAAHNLTSIQIGLGSYTGGAMLMYQERTARFYDTYAIQVSSDNTNWVTIGKNENIQPRYASNNTPASLTNPEYVGYYIPASIMSASGNLWVRFRWSDTNSGVAYGWLIDDVVVYKAPANDLEVNRTYMYGVADSGAYQKYSQIPMSQAGDATFKPAALVLANGTNAQSDVVVNVTETKTGYASASASQAMNSESFAIIETADDFVLDGLGNYSMTYTATSGTTDAFMLNTTKKWNFKVTQNVYAYDDNEPQSSGAYGTSGNTMCLYYDNFANDTVIGVQGHFPKFEGASSESGLKYGQLLSATVYEVDATTGDPVNALGTSGFYEVTGGTAGTYVDNWVNIPVTAAIPVTTSAYYACISAYEGGIPMSYDYGVAGYARVDPDNAGAWFSPITTPYDTFNILPYIRVKTANTSLCSSTNIVIIGTVEDVTETYQASIDVLSITGGTAPYSLTWTGPNGFTSTQQSLTGLLNKGVYVISAVDANGCKGSMSFTVDGNLGVADLSVNTINVYPNPTSHLINFELPESGVYNVTISTIKGEIVKKAIVNSTTGNKNQLDVSDLTSGTYFINMVDASGNKNVSELIVK